MRRPWLIAIGVLLLLLLIVTFLNCGRASAAPGSDRIRRNKVASSYLSTSQQQLISAKQGVTCKRAEATFVFENYIGNELFSITLIPRWCFDGKKVTSVRWQYDHHVGNYAWNAWRFQEWNEPVHAGGVGQRYAFQRIKATFAINVLWFQRQVTPWVQCTVRGDGDFSCGKGI